MAAAPRANWAVACQAAQQWRPEGRGCDGFFRPEPPVRPGEAAVPGTVRAPFPAHQSSGVRSALRCGAGAESL